MFEMGTGVTSLLLSPDLLLVNFAPDFVVARTLRYSCTFVHSVPRCSHAASSAKFPAQLVLAFQRFRIYCTLKTK